MLQKIRRFFTSKKSEPPGEPALTTLQKRRYERAWAFFNARSADEVAAMLREHPDDLLSDDAHQVLVATGVRLRQERQVFMLPFLTERMDLLAACRKDGVEAALAKMPRATLWDILSLVQQLADAPTDERRQEMAHRHQEVVHDPRTAALVELMIVVANDMEEPQRVEALQRCRSVVRGNAEGAADFTEESDSSPRTLIDTTAAVRELVMAESNDDRRAILERLADVLLTEHAPLVLQVMRDRAETRSDHAQVRRINGLAFMLDACRKSGVDGGFGYSAARMALNELWNAINTPEFDHILEVERRYLLSSDAERRLGELTERFKNEPGPRELIAHLCVVIERARARHRVPSPQQREQALGELRQLVARSQERSRALGYRAADDGSGDERGDRKIDELTQITDDGVDRK
jgi:hypothetical protein